MKPSQLLVSFVEFLVLFSKAVEEIKISLKESPTFFENHPSIVNIKRIGFSASFTFR